MVSDFLQRRTIENKWVQCDAENLATTKPPVGCRQLLKLAIRSPNEIEQENDKRNKNLFRYKIAKETFIFD